MAQLSLPFPPGGTLIFSNGPSLTVQGEPKAFVPGFCEYKVGGTVVGTLDATFDFTDMPPELHAAAIKDILSSRHSMELGAVAHLYWPDKYDDPWSLPRPRREPVRDQWWAGLGRWWRGLGFG